MTVVGIFVFFKERLRIVIVSFLNGLRTLRDLYNFVSYHGIGPRRRPEWVEKTIRKPFAGFMRSVVTASSVDLDNCCALAKELHVNRLSVP